MKKFLAKVFACSIFLGVLILCCMFVRLWMWDVIISKELDIRPSTRVLCVGNSHTGCTWVDSEELGVQVLWLDSGPLPFAQMRLEEVERRCGFRSVEAVIVDCDMTSLKVASSTVQRCVEVQWPLACRHLDILPLNKYRAAYPCFAPLLRKWTISGSATKSVRRWSDLTDKEKVDDIKHYQSAEPPIPDMKKWVWRSLSSIDELCKRNNLKLYVMMAPLTKEKFSLNAASETEWIDELRQYGYNVLDYCHACPDEDFQDNHHLNYPGRCKFTKAHLKDVLEGGIK